MNCVLSWTLVVANDSQARLAHKVSREHQAKTAHRVILESKDSLASLRQTAPMESSAASAISETKVGYLTSLSTRSKLTRKQVTTARLV